MTAVTGAIHDSVHAETTFATPDSINGQREPARFQVFSAVGHEMTRRAEQPAGLTPREGEILRLLACGLLNKQIARLLGIAPKTVGNHVEHIYAKIGVSSRAAAGVFAAAHGLISFANTTAGRSATGTLQPH